MSWPEWPVRGRWGQQWGTQHWTLGNSVRHRWAEKQEQVRWIWAKVHLYLAGSELIFKHKHFCSPGVFLVLSCLCDAQSYSLWKHVAQKDLPVIWCLCSSWTGLSGCWILTWWTWTIRSSSAWISQLGLEMAHQSRARHYTDTVCRDTWWGKG